MLTLLLPAMRESAVVVMAQFWGERTEVKEKMKKVPLSGASSYSRRCSVSVYFAVRKAHDVADTTVHTNTLKPHTFVTTPTDMPHSQPPFVHT